MVIVVSGVCRAAARKVSTSAGNSLAVAMKKQSFLYFAYGSNLLTERIHISNPSAVKRSVAKLQDYRLLFNLYGESWHGAAATIAPSSGDCVWGIVWELDIEDQAHLDRQERGYEYRTVNVECQGNGDKLECRTYLITKPVIGDQLPSRVYKDVIVRGAIEHGLPSDYVDQLEQIEDNGYNGPVSVQLPSARRG